MSADRPGKLLAGKYELVEVIGEGGMALVWRGLTRGAGGFARPVAIKRVRSQLLSEELVHLLFVEEARVGSKLPHPNIVQVHDFGEDEDGSMFLVSELIDGMDLGEYVSAFQGLGAGPPWQIVSAIAVEVLKALDAAHTRVDERGRPAAVLHRDVTPQNIMLDVSGVVKLTDFGMARAMDRARMTQPDMVKGKLSYLAPELVLGVDPSVQSDIFSLGVVLWEALAGKRLFDAKTDFEVIQLLKNPRVPMLSMQRSGLPLALTTAVHQALEQDPRRRFESARDMLVSLSMGLRTLPEPVDQRVLTRSFRAARDQLTKTTKMSVSYEGKAKR